MDASSLSRREQKLEVVNVKEVKQEERRARTGKEHNE